MRCSVKPTKLQILLWCSVSYQQCLSRRIGVLPKSILSPKKPAARHLCRTRSQRLLPHSIGRSLRSQLSWSVLW